MSKEIIGSALALALIASCSSAPESKAHFPEGANVFSTPNHRDTCDTLTTDYTVTDPKPVHGERDENNPTAENGQTFVTVQYNDLPKTGSCASLPNFRNYVYLDLGVAKTNN